MRRLRLSPSTRHNLAWYAITVCIRQFAKKFEKRMSMPLWEVKMGRPGGGSGTFVVHVHAGTPDQARRTAEAQNPGYSAQSVRRA